MKKEYVFTLAGILLLSLFFLPQTAAAESCNIDIKMINQDPYPAIPGDFVKIIFQIDGISNINCNEITFKLIEEYPITLHPSQQEEYQFDSGIYEEDFRSYFLAPYEAKVDEGALDGDTPLEVQYSLSGDPLIHIEKFNLTVEDARADFEVFIKNYDPTSQILTLEILNIAKADVEGLTIDIPKQEGVEIFGAKTNIIGNLDSNEYTTADFKAELQEGIISLKIHYTDQTNERRSIEKQISFEPEYFPKTKSGPSAGTYIILIIIIGGIVYFFYRKAQKKKKARQHHHTTSHK